MRRGALLSQQQRGLSGAPRGRAPFPLPGSARELEGAIMSKLPSSTALVVAFALAGPALGVAAQASAASDCRPSAPASESAAWDEAFGRLDRDGDGALTNSEYAGCDAGAPAFGALDADGDGKIGKAEFRTAEAVAAGASSATGPATQRLAQSGGSDSASATPTPPTSSGATRSSVSAAAGSRDAASAMMGMKARDLIGRDVVNAAGREVGEIDDIVMNEQDNAIYAIVGVGGFLGLGEKDVAIPFEQLRLGADNVILMSEKGASDLKQMPSYKPGQWRSLSADQTLKDR